MSYTGLNKLNCFIKVQKDRLNKDKKTGVVYKINCRDCDASYVGQTKRLLKTRIEEHKKHISRNSTQKSVITDHCLNNHEFDWENIEILDEEPILHKRLLSEMIFIKRQKNSLNLQTDTECLDYAFANIVEGLSKI